MLEKSVLINQTYSVSLSGQFVSAPKVICQGTLEVQVEQLRNFARVNIQIPAYWRGCSSY
jgi:hypothetical protein